jgi:hypothetical protein
MTLDLSIDLKSMSIIVAPYHTVEQAAFLVMGLAASPHMVWMRSRKRRLPSTISNNPRLRRIAAEKVYRGLHKQRKETGRVARQLLERIADKETIQGFARINSRALFQSAQGDNTLDCVVKQGRIGFGIHLPYQMDKRTV